MTKQEKDIEQALVRMIRRHGGECLKFTSPGNTGVPDRVCLVPGIPVFFVELKRPDGGVVSAKQKYWADRLEGFQIYVYIIKNHAEIQALEAEIEAQQRDRRPEE